MFKKINKILEVGKRRFDSSYILISEYGLFNSIKVLFLPIQKYHLDSPTNVSDIACDSNCISSTSGGRYMSKWTYVETFPLMAFTSLVMEIAARLEHVIAVVHDLGNLVAFQH